MMITQTTPLYNQRLINIKQDLSLFGAKSYSKLENAWRYAGKSFLAARYTINGVLHSCRWIALSCQTQKHLRGTVLYLKTLSIVSAALNLPSIRPSVSKVMANWRFRDPEGVALSSLSASVLFLDTFDSITTFVSGTLGLLNKPSIGWMSSIGLPLSFSIVAGGSVIRTVKIIKISGMLKAMDRDILRDLERKELTPDELKTVVGRFVNNKIPLRGISNEVSQETLGEYQKYKRSKIERQSNSAVLKLVDQLASYLDDDAEWSDEKAAEAVKVLYEMKKALKAEREIQCGYLLTNMINATAMALFYFSAPYVYPLYMLAASMMMRIGLQAVQDFS